MKFQISARKLSRLLPLSTARNDIYNTFTAATEWSRAKTEFMTLLQCEGNLCKSDKVDKAEEEAPFEI